MIKIVAKTNNVDNSIIDNMKFLAQIRTALLNDSVAKEICNDNGMGEWFLTAVPIRFEELPVSAKTQEGSIVLNSKLKVKGIDNLRVFDVSMMPNIVSANTNAPAMAIADRATNLMLED